MTQLQDLAKPFEKRFIEQKGNHGSYVAHDVITQKLLAVLGPFDFAITEIIRSGEQNQVEGIVCRLTVTIDGRLVTVEEIGDCENPSNWKTEGARLKDAASDGIKRCAMRLGCGLHLWAQENYVLDKALERNEGGSEDGAATTPEEPPTEPAPKASSVAPPQKSESPARSPQSSSDQTGADVGDSAKSEEGDSRTGEVSSVTPSSEALADSILNSVDAGFVKINPLLHRASQLALEAKALPKNGLGRSTLSELPAAILLQLSSEFNISQEALSV